MRHLSPALLLAFAFAACDQSSVTEPVQSITPSFSAHGGAGASSTGHWEVDFGGGFIEQFSFSAVRNPKGNFNGQWQVNGFSNGELVYTVHGATTCMTVLPDGKTARVGGRVTNIHGDLPAFLVGRDAAWIVRDNGEGANAPSDLASDIRFGFLPGRADFNCNVGIASVFLRPIGEPGNIQVRP